MADPSRAEILGRIRAALADRPPPAPILRNYRHGGASTGDRTPGRCPSPSWTPSAAHLHQRTVGHQLDIEFDRVEGVHSLRTLDVPLTG